MLADSISNWWRTATEPSIVRRAIKTSLLIGTILICINHWDSLLAGDVTVGRVVKMALTYLVPYAVSTSASVSATMAMRGAA